MGWVNVDYAHKVAVSVGTVSAILTVEVLAAIPDEVWDDSAYARKRPVVLPALRVTNLRTYDEVGDPIIIRKRGYSVDEVFKVTDHGPWSTDGRHYGSQGPRNDTGAKVDHGTATRKLLDQLAEAARDQFVAENPQWQVTSRLRRLDTDITHALGDAEKLRAEQWKAEERVTRLRAERDLLADS